MESFSRVDIFDTKGIEYLFVIGYLLILVIFWKISGKQVGLKARLQKALGSISTETLRIPKGLFYNKQHTWAHLDVSGIARVGLDDFIQHVTGDVKISFPRVHEEVLKKGDLLAVIEQEGKKLNVFSPISGRVVSTNDLIEENSGIVNEDPYYKGWLYEIEPTSWLKETSSYYLADKAVEWSKKELERFKDFMAMGPMKEYSTEPAMVILQDGGEIRDHILSELPGEVWHEFQKKFLDFSEH